MGSVRCAVGGGQCAVGGGWCAVGSVRCAVGGVRILPRTGGSEFELFSSNITRATKHRRMSWAGHVARMGEKRNAYRILVGKTLRIGIMWKTWM